MHEHINSITFDLDSFVPDWRARIQHKNWPLGLTEAAVLALTNVDVPTGCISRNFIPFYTKYNMIDPCCFVHHLPDKYTNMPDTDQGKALINSLLRDWGNTNSCGCLCSTHNTDFYLVRKESPTHKLDLMRRVYTGNCCWVYWFELFWIAVIVSCRRKFSNTATKSGPTVVLGGFLPHNSPSSKGFKSLPLIPTTINF